MRSQTGPTVRALGTGGCAGRTRRQEKRPLHLVRRSSPDSIPAVRIKYSYYQLKWQLCNVIIFAMIMDRTRGSLSTRSQPELIELCALNLIRFRP